MTRFTPLWTALAAAALALPAAAVELSTTTPRGAVLQVIADHPAGPGPFPALVLAPGTGYHMGQPALEQLARQLVAQGVVVYRFNWAYFTAQPRGEPSPGERAEVEDLQTVIEATRADPKVNASRIAVGGKSFGSIVAWRVFAADSRLRSAVLLTPVCSRPGNGNVVPVSLAAQAYPGLTAETRSVLMVAGDQDPQCNVNVLYGHAAQGKGGLRLGVVGGDHVFERAALGGDEAAQALKRNVAAAAQLGANFVIDTLIP